jgi:hypothetical protein
MAIASMTISEWDGVIKHDTEIDCPSWPDVESAIRALNNCNLNDLYLQPFKSNADTYLCIGGGAGQYLVSGAVNVDEYFPTLVDPERLSEPRKVIVVGGQSGDYPANWIADLKTVLHAAKSFYDHGGFTADVNWVNV